MRRTLSHFLACMAAGPACADAEARARRPQPVLALPGWPPLWQACGCGVRCAPARAARVGLQLRQHRLQALGDLVGPGGQVARRPHLAPVLQPRHSRLPRLQCHRMQKRRADVARHHQLGNRPGQFAPRKHCPGRPGMCMSACKDACVPRPCSQQRLTPAAAVHRRWAGCWARRAANLRSGRLQRSGYLCIVHHLRGPTACAPYPALTRLLFTLHGPASPAASAASDAAARMPPGCRLRARGARGGAHVAGRVTQQGPRAGGAQESPVLMPGLKHDSQLDPPPSAARRQARRPGRAPESAAQRARRGRPAAARRRSCGCRCRSRGGARRSAASDRAWARPTSPAGPCAAARPGARPKPGHGQSRSGTTAQSAACLAQPPHDGRELAALC